MANVFATQALDDIRATTIRGKALVDTRKTGGEYLPVRLGRRTSEPNLLSLQNKGRFVWPDPPSANIDHPKKVSQQAVLDAIVYTEYRMKLRDTTPRTKEFLRQFNAVAQDCLAKPLEQEHTVAFVTLNKVLHSKRILQRVQPPGIQQLMDALLELRQKKFLSDYGDYLMVVCHNFRKVANDANVKGLANFSGGKTWAMVQKSMEDERARVARWHAKGCVGGAMMEPESPVVDSIANACTELGVDLDHLMYCIEWASKGCESSHSGVSELVKHCDFTGLGNQLFIDLADVPSYYGAEVKAKMLEIIESPRQKYFLRLGPGSNHKLSVAALELQLGKAAKAVRRAKAQADQAVADQRKKDTAQRQQLRAQQARPQMQNKGRRVGGASAP
ncbi:MAG: hypothetical protein Q9218_004132 [Villophora microphyllina]